MIRKYRLPKYVAGADARRLRSLLGLKVVRAKSALAAGTSAETPTES